MPLKPIKLKFIWAAIALFSISVLGTCLINSKAFTDDCECLEYKKVTKTTVYPDARFTVEKDSICTLYSKGRVITSLTFK